MDWALLLDSRSHTHAVRAFFDRVLQRLDILRPSATASGRPKRLACLVSRSRRAVVNLRNLCDLAARRHALDLDELDFPKFVTGPHDGAFRDDLNQPFDLLDRLQAVSQADVVITPHGSLAFNSFFCRHRPPASCLVFSVGGERETPLLTAMPWLFHVNHAPLPAAGDVFVDTVVDGVKALSLNISRALAAFDAAFHARDQGIVSSYRR